MCCLVIVGITTALNASVRTIGLLFLISAIRGFGQGLLEVLLNVWIVEMWEQDCGPYIQGIHFMASISAITAPLMMEPYLNNVSKLYIPFTIIGIFIVISGLYLGSLYFYKKYTPRVINKDNKENQSVIKILLINFKVELMPTKPIFIYIILCSLLLTLTLGLLSSQQNYLSTFAQSCGLHLTDTYADYLTTGLSVAQAVSRLIAIPLSKYISPQIIIICGLTLVLISNILLWIFSNYSLTVMWVANILYGFGIGPFYASCYHLIEQITPVTATMGVFLSLMMGIIQIIIPCVLGVLMESNPFSLIYLNLILLFFSFIVILLIFILNRNFIAIHTNQSKPT